MGNAVEVWEIDIGDPVHPHVHGERELINPPCKKRFIPTYMGNAIIPLLFTISYTVHPHVHGERSSSCIPRLTLHGSSPRTWGTRYRF